MYMIVAIRGWTLIGSDSFFLDLKKFYYKSKICNKTALKILYSAYPLIVTFFDFLSNFGIKNTTKNSTKPENTP